MKKLLLIGCFALCGCPALPENSDTVQAKKQEQMNAESNAQVGMPAITRFQEKRMLKMILELRDTEVTTYTYVSDMNSKLHLRCQSIGFGFPYATQFTNPQKLTQVRTADGSYHYEVLPQADPNGLFSPGSAEGTWIMCLNKKKNEVKPVYVEDRVTISPFELDL